MTIKPASFTQSFNSNDSRLLSIVGVIPPLPDKETSDIETKDYIAMWDTGCNFCAISPKVVKDLQLTTTKKLPVKTPLRKERLPLHLVHILLESGKLIHDVHAVEAPLEDIDVLIGMNIIGIGDFSVSSFGGKILFKRSE